MKKSNQLLDIYTNTWGIWKEKIEVIINKESPNGIECEIVKRILKNYRIIGRIKNAEEQLEISYSKILESINFIPKVSFFSKFFTSRPVDVVQTNRIPNGMPERFNANTGRISNRERMIINAN